MIEMLAVVGPLEGKTFPPPGDKDKTGQLPGTTSAKSTSTPVPKPNAPARWRRPLQALLRLIGLTRRNGRR